MPFFVFYIENLGEGYVNFNVIHFDSNEEKDAFFKSNLKKGDKITYLKSDTLLDIISQKNYELNLNDGTYEDVLAVVDKFKEEFGELISLEFPAETLNRDFINRVIDECDNMHSEIMFDSLEDVKKNNHTLNSNGWEESCQDEPEKWDEETDGSWKVGNDFG